MLAVPFEALRDLLRPRRREWQMRFFVSAEEALRELACRPADVVVTDLRMPGMDGVTLLQEVSRIAEATVRIVLSGYAGTRSLAVPSRSPRRS